MYVRMIHTYKEEEDEAPAQGSKVWIFFETSRGGETVFVWLVVYASQSQASREGERERGGEE